MPTVVVVPCSLSTNILSLCMCVCGVCVCVGGGSLSRVRHCLYAEDLELPTLQLPYRPIMFRNRIIINAHLVKSPLCTVVAFSIISNVG